MLSKQASRVLVTGGAGFIGSHLVDRLVAEGFSVRVLDNLSTGCMANIQDHVDSGKVDFVKGDVKDSKVVGECVRGVGFVVHLAAVVSVPFSVANPGLTFEANVSGTLNVLVACAKARVSRFGSPSKLSVFHTYDRAPTC